MPMQEQVRFREGTVVGNIKFGFRIGRPDADMLCIKGEGCAAKQEKREDFHWVDDFGLFQV